MVSTRLPLFPLGTVLYPGLLLPLHIFEPRYRKLVADLLDGPEPREFGVIAIRRGGETGVDGVSALYATGCSAIVRRVEAYEDGRFDMVTVGSRRFTLVSLGDAAPYFTGEVEFLPDDPDDPEGGNHHGEDGEAAMVVPAVRESFRSYLDLLAERGGAQITVPEIPDEPVLLSYLVAAAVVADLPVKQQLLEEPDAHGRLLTERRLLAHEMQMMRLLMATPAPDLRYSPYSKN